MTVAYIAGFFDGEGSITHSKKGCRISISQTNKKVLQEIQRKLRIGAVFKNTKRQPHWKESWVYYIAKQKDVGAFITTVYPHIIVKKPVARRALASLKKTIPHIEKKEALANYRKKQVVLLRRHGATYREIGEKLGLDWSYARRLTLRQLKQNVA